MNTLYLLLLNSLVIYGIHTLFSEGHLLEGAGKVLERAIGSYWSKPLFMCPICMASFHGTVFFFLLVPLDVIYWPFYCLALCGLNRIINDLKSKHFTIDSED